MRFKNANGDAERINDKIVDCGLLSTEIRKRKLAREQARALRNFDPSKVSALDNEKIIRSLEKPMAFTARMAG